MCLDQKECSVCHQIKHISEFERGRNGKPTSRCKACANAYKRARYAGTKLNLLLEQRIAKLQRFCNEHNIKIKVEVLNEKDDWC